MRGWYLCFVLASVLLLFLGCGCWSATGGDNNWDSSFEQSMWFSWGVFFDPGTQTGIAADEPFKVPTSSSTAAVYDHRLRGQIKLVGAFFSVLGLPDGVDGVLLTLDAAGFVFNLVLLGIIVDGCRTALDRQLTLRDSATCWSHTLVC